MTMLLMTSVPVAVCWQ